MQTLTIVPQQFHFDRVLRFFFIRHHLTTSNARKPLDGPLTTLNDPLIDFNQITHIEIVIVQVLIWNKCYNAKFTVSPH